MAERQGFEPWVELPPQRFSRPPHSTTLAPLHNMKIFNQKLVILQQPVRIHVVDILSELRDKPVTKKIKMQLRSCRRILIQNSFEANRRGLIRIKNVCSFKNWG